MWPLTWGYFLRLVFCPRRAAVTGRPLLDQVVAERDELRAELAAIRAELAAIRAERDAFWAELDSADAMLARLGAQREERRPDVRN